MQATEGDILASQPAAATAETIESSDPAPEDSSAWRQELASRLNRYQARRKPRPPRYPSLRLRFEDDVNARGADDGNSQPGFPSEMPAFSHQALALDRFDVDPVHVHAAEEPESAQISEANSYPDARPVAASLACPPVAPLTAKILEFPRSWTPPPPPLDELADPVIDRPRILEAPEIVPPAPALGGITIEPAQAAEVEKLRGIDIPLQSAPLSRRILAAAVDGAIVAAAGVVFAAVFWKITTLRPPILQIAGLACGFCGTFWGLYQYLLVVYSGATPGLRLAGLELARFDGSPANRRLRRWRVLASFLSAISLGMGYAWVFLDEDALCWHDRITHTYLAPKA
jgi:uncharacterized RDD family membrane protein YckC